MRHNTEAISIYPKRLILKGEGKQSLKATNILIVDDDIDSALLVDSVFARLGCETNCSLSYREALEKLCSSHPDIIIMDWMLDHQKQAHQIVERCAETFARYGVGPGHGLWKKPKIITYSSLPAYRIQSLANSYFEHLDHWRKPMKRQELLSRVLGLLGKVGC